MAKSDSRPGDVRDGMFVAGYLQALDDVAKALAVPADAGFLAKLRAKAVGVKGRAAKAKATGGKAP